MEEFADYGGAVLVSTAVGGVVGGVGANALPGHSCFVAGTQVQTEDGPKPIEEIQVGDLVWAWDEETGDTALKPVLETYVNETDELVHVWARGEEIVCTPSHPFYSPVKGWTDAVHLRAGDILVLVNGEYVVVEKVQHEILESPVTVYNFQVADYHTYYVASSGVLVHNSCKASIDDAPTSPVKISENKLKGVDVHTFKKDYVYASVARWDIYKDTANNSEIWIGNKAQAVWVKTGLLIQELLEIYPAK